MGGGGSDDDEIGILREIDVRERPAPPPWSQRDVRTGRPVNASNVRGRTNSAAAAVSTTSTVAPASVSRRARIQLL